jgi:hypothetical protein
LSVNALEYLRYCQYLNGFNYKLRIDEDEYTESIKKIFDEDPDKPTIIFMPTSTSTQALSDFDKYQSVEAIRRAINHNRNLNIVSLVDEKERMNTLKYIEQNKDDIDVVINIKVASEGFDWSNCTRAIICGHRTSILELPQNIGRVMRDHANKENTQPEVIQIISNVKTTDTEQVELKDIFNNIMKLVGGQLLLLSDLYSNEATKIQKIGSKQTSVVDYLSENITVEDRLKLNHDLETEFMKFATLNDEYTDEDLIEIIKEKITEYNLEDSEPLVRYLLSEQKRRTWNTAPKESVKSMKKKLQSLYHGLNVDDIDFDLVGDEIDSLGWIKNLASIFFDINTFNELETILNSFRRFERIKELKQWVIDNKRLPSVASEDIYEKSLSKFLSYLRQMKKGTREQRLSKSEIELIESIPNWEWSMFELSNKTNFDSKEELEKFLSEWKASGENIREFCEDRSVSYEYGLLKAVDKFNVDYKKQKKLFFKSKEHVEAFISEWENSGKPLANFCRDKQTWDTQFYHAVKKFNVTYQNNRRQTLLKTEEDLDNFLKEWATTEYGIKEFCDKKGISPTPFYNLVKKYNVDYRLYKSFFKSKQQVEEFIEEWKSSGKGITEFCKYKGTDLHHFYPAVKKFKVEYTNTTRQPYFKTKKDLEHFIKELKISGKSVADFCQDRGKSKQCFYRAVKKFNLNYAT